MAGTDVSPTPRLVESDRAMPWLREGWTLFMLAPGVWIAITVVLMLIHLLLAAIPAIGQLTSAILTPILTAGLMDCSRVAVSRQPVLFEQMFAGFRQQTGRLVVVGILALIAFALISIVAFAILAIVGGSALLGAVQSGSFSSIDVVSALGAILMALLVWLALAVPVTMTLWFAPALVMFDNMAPIDALKSSFHASMKNWLVLSVYGLIWLVLACVAVIPFGLGFLLLIPVTILSVYLSYRDIYHADAVPARR